MSSMKDMLPVQALYEFYERCYHCRPYISSMKGYVATAGLV